MCAFLNKLFSNKLSRRVFLEQKKLKHLPLLADLQVSIAELLQESVTPQRTGCVKRKLQ